MNHFQRTRWVSTRSNQWRPLVAAFGFVALMIAMTMGSTTVAAAAASAPNSGANSRGQVVLTRGKSPEIYDPRWVALKLAHKISVPGHLYAQPGKMLATASSSLTLDTSVVQNTLEPYGNVPGNNSACVNDDAGHCYIDRYYWNLCGPGAVDNALYYWNGKTSSFPAGSYTEPSYAPYRQTTYWTSGDHNRSYLMYIADNVWVPGWGTPGMETYYAYSSAGTYLDDITKTLNWEASGENTTTWQNYFYLQVSNSGLSASTLNSDIVQDISSGVPVVAEVNTTYLPNWGVNGITHYITIIGYDNTNGTYTYVDSCGRACGSFGSGVHTINQTAPDQYGNNLLAAITGVGSGGGYAW